MLTSKQQDDFRNANRDLQHLNVMLLAGKVSTADYDTQLSAIVKRLKTIAVSIQRTWRE